MMPVSAKRYASWKRDLHDRQDLEEVVLRKVLVRVMGVQGPEVVDSLAYWSVL